MKKISIVGLGNIGSSVAFLMSLRNDFHIACKDNKENVANGKILDITHGIKLINPNSKITSFLNPDGFENSDIVIITAGAKRSPGMTREDLFDVNINIIKNIAKDVKTYAPDAFVIIITNPLDAMVRVFVEESEFKREMVVGMSGDLDTSRFKTLISEKTGISVNKIDAQVIGMHNDDMLPVLSNLKINGKNYQEFISEEDMTSIISQTKKMGATISSLMETSAYQSPAVAASLIAESYLLDKNKEHICSFYSKGEFGFENTCFSLPVIINKNGINKILIPELSKHEEDELKNAIKKSIII